MSRITVGQENTTPIELYYEDHGSGPPVVLIHGWPLSGASWEKQVAPLLAGGYRVITYDRRGFGQSSKPASGYDYDTLAEDLSRLLTKLHLRSCTLVGFSMGGGEVARYLGKYGSSRVEKAVFMAAIPPFLVKTPDNPTGVDPAGFVATQQALVSDRPAYLSEFFAKFYNVDVLGGTRVSAQAVQASWNVAVGASARATHDCVRAWQSDFRSDVASIDVPTLIVHGDADRIVPAEVTAMPLSRLVKGAHLVIVKGAPHGLNWTHADQVNEELLRFLGKPAAVSSA